MGFVVLFGWLAGKGLERWTAVFLATTVATSVTGYGFPFEHLLPSHVVGAISLVALAVAIAARYAFHLRGAWRRVYIIAAVAALYLNVFVGVVQSFLKVPALKALAPNQKRAPVRPLAGRRPARVHRPGHRGRHPLPRRERDRAADAPEMSPTVSRSTRSSSAPPWSRRAARWRPRRRSWPRRARTSSGSRRSGLSAYFEVLEAQQQLFPAEIALAQTQRDQLVDVVDLYRALGGGWQAEESARQAGPQSGGR